VIDAPLPYIMRDTRTNKQRVVFEYLFEFTRQHGYQPSIREMSEHFKLPNPNSIAQYINQLIERRWLGPAPTTGKHTARAVAILRRPDSSPFEGFQ
jgi:SOS-response transcriptional repressor LexA